MFDDTTIKILGNSYVNTPIKSFEGDFQDYTSSIDKDEYSYICTKLLFVDYIEPLILENIYVDINSKIYKVIKVDTCSDHMEVYLFLYNLKNITVNNISKKVLIQETTDKISLLDEKIIISDFEIKTGDLIEFQTIKWITISEIATDSDGLEYRCRMRKCNNNLKYKVNLDGVDTIYSIPSIIDKGTLSIDDGEYFATLDNSLSCTVPYSLINLIQPILDSKVVLRFIINSKYWQVLTTDDASQMSYKNQGVIIIKLESALSVAEDNFETGLAYNEAIIIGTAPEEPEEPVETIFYINGSDTLNSSTTQIYKIVDENGEDITDVLFTFSLVKFGDYTPSNLITIKGSSTNSISFARKSGMSGTFTLKAVQKTDATVILLKNIRVG